MINEEIWNGWQRDWEWVLSSMRKKGAWEVSDPVIDPPASMDYIMRIEQEGGIVLPTEFVEVLARYSARVEISWWLNDPFASGKWWLNDPPFNRPPEPTIVAPGAYREVEAAQSTLWSIDHLGRFNNHVQDYIRVVDSNDPIWQGKTAFIKTAGGDYIALDVSQGNRNCPVIYLDHEHGPLHGVRLGLNFVDFITRWSNLGCPGPEIWTMEPFYDPVQNLLMDSGEVVENWKQWVNE